MNAGASRARHGQFLAYLGCSFSLGVFSSFNNFALTLWLATFTSSYLLLSLLGNSKSFEGAIVSPLFAPGPIGSGPAGWAGAAHSSSSAASSERSCSP